MALAHNPRIVTDGLVLYYDMGNDKKSWRGKPTTNKHSNTSTLAEWELNDVTYSNGKIIAGTSSTPHFVLQDTPLTSGVTYTQSVEVKYNGVRYFQIAPSIGFSYTFAAFDLLNGTLAGGATSNATITSTTNGYYKCTFTATATSTRNGRMAFGPNTSSTSRLAAWTGNGINGVFLKNPQFEEGTFATPFVDGTRTNTESILDLTNNKTLTINSLDYTSDGKFLFDGSSAPVTLGTQLIGTGNDVTVEMVFRSADVGTDNFSLMLGWGVGNNNNSNLGIGDWFSGFSDESIYFGLDNGAVVGSYRGGSTLYHDGDYHHAVFVLSPDNYKIIVDSQDLPISYYRGSSSTNVGDIFSFGRDDIVTIIGNRPYGGGDGPFNGEIPLLSVYNRALSAAEIKQNFNALRGRYGI